APRLVDSNGISELATAGGSSIWNHMPGAWGAWLLHEVMLRAPFAPSGLWLAVTFQVASGRSAFGSVASSSGTVQGCLRDEVAARTRCTSDALTTPPALPKLVRTYDATEAI